MYKIILSCVLFNGNTVSPAALFKRLLIPTLELHGFHVRGLYGQIYFFMISFCLSDHKVVLISMIYIPF